MSFKKLQGKEVTVCIMANGVTQLTEIKGTCTEVDKHGLWLEPSERRYADNPLVRYTTTNYLPWCNVQRVVIH